MNQLVSIIIPCYNAASLVSETLDSVFAQTYKNIEMIIVNDGSTDTLEEVIDPYLKKYTNIKYIYQENKGAPASRNNGANHAKGEYLLFLDSDDLIAPTYIEKCVIVLNANKEVRLVYSQALFFGAQKGVWDFPIYSLPTLLKGNIIHISALMRRSDFELFGPFDEALSFYEDWDLWISMLKDGGDVVLLKGRLFFYRKRHDKSSLTDNMLSNKSIDDNNRKCLYEKHSDIYIKIFGSTFDILVKLFDQESELVYLRKKNEKRFSKRIRRFLKRLFG